MTSFGHTEMALGPVVVSVLTLSAEAWTRHWRAK
jgi:hypothetical protein